ncbi:MAG: EI24 domain-containing protein [Flavobacteriaceae bacterium]|nr:EI24 domain-containing protein [Flavobacteriaceae bacterium]
MLKAIIIGIKSYFKSFYLISELKLWRYFIIPIMVSLITLVSIGISAYIFSDTIAQYFIGVLPWYLGDTWTSNILEILSAATIIIFGIIIYKYIVLALSAPFMSTVSEKIEMHVTGKINHNYRNTSFIQQLWRGIRINLRNLCKELLLTILILALSFIPIIGLFSSILLFLLQAYYAGFGNIDYTLERHFNYKTSLQFVQKNRGLAIGNGIVFMLLLLIPVIGALLVLPLSVTAASASTLKKLQLEIVEKTH